MSFRKESHNENIKILHQKSFLNIMAIFYRVRQACRFWWTALLASTEILIGDGHSYDSPGKVQLFNFLSEYNRKPFWHRNLGLSLNLALYLHRKLCCREKSHEPTLNEWHWKAVCELLKYFVCISIHTPPYRWMCAICTLNFATFRINFTISSSFTSCEWVTIQRSNPQLI